MSRLLLSYINVKNFLLFAEIQEEEFIMFYPSHSIRSMQEDKLFLKFNFQHPLIPKFIMHSSSIFYLKTVTSEDRERKPSLPGVAMMMARQPTGGWKAYILGPYSLLTRTNSSFYRAQLYSLKVDILGGGRDGTMIRLRKNNTEAFFCYF